MEQKLLAPKALSAFSPSEFKEYVRSLFFKKTPRRTKTIKLKKVKPPVVWSLTKKGNLSVRIQRTPRWISREEVEAVVRESGLPYNEVWLKIFPAKPPKGREPVRLSTQKDEDELLAFDRELPW